MVRKTHLPQFLMSFLVTLSVLFLSGCPGAGVGQSGNLTSEDEDAPEVSSKPTSFQFVSDANSLTASNLKTSLTVNVVDAFGVAVNNVQVRFSLANAADEKVVQLGKLTSGSEVVVLSSGGVATVELKAKATGNPSQEVEIRANLVGYDIEAKSIKLFIKEIPLSFTVKDLPTIMFNKGSFEFVSIQVRDPEGNPVNGVPVTIVKNTGSPLKFYDISTSLTGGNPTKSEVLSYTTEGDGIVSFNLWANETSGSQPITTNFNIRVGASTNDAVPSDNVTIYFVQLTNTGSNDDLKANGHAQRTLEVSVAGDIDTSTHFIRWKTTLGNISGKGLTINKLLPYSEINATSKKANATLSVANEFGSATITASLIKTLSDFNDKEVVIAEISYTIKFLEAVPATVTLVVQNKSLVAGSGNVFALSGQVTDSEGIGINNASVSVAIEGTVPLESVSLLTTALVNDIKGAFSFNASAFNKAGRWKVTVKAGNISNSITIEQLSDVPSAILVNNGQEVGSIFVKGTGNKENTSIEFKVLDRFGNTVSDNLGVKVGISIQSGPGGGEQVDPTAPTDTVNGVVSANIRSGNRSGTVRVHAEIENNPNISADTNISIVKGPLDASSINITPAFDNVSGRAVTNMDVNVFSSLADAAGDAVPDGQGVTFLTKGTGNFFKNGSANTVNGVASDTLVTAINPDPFFGFSVLMSEANGGKEVYVSAMAFLNNSTISFAGTIGGGVRKTNSLANGSVKWVDAFGEYNWCGQIIKDLVIPFNTSTVFAATASGLFKSTNLGSTWTSIRNPSNANKPGYTIDSLNTSTITAVALANQYITTSSSVDTEELAKNPADIDVIVGTNGEGVYHNNNRGESFFIIDADGTTTDGDGYASSTVLDGNRFLPFDIGRAPNLYYMSNGSRAGFLIATTPSNVATYSWLSVKPSGSPLPTLNEFNATDGTGAIAVQSHTFQNVFFNDKNLDGDYDVGEEILGKGVVRDGVFSGGWRQSSTLGNGVFIKKLTSQKPSSTTYVISATTEGVFASVGTSSVGDIWSNIGINNGDVLIKRALINDVFLKTDLTLYAATGESGVYKFTGLGAITKTPATVTTGWSRLSIPTARDTVLNKPASATNKEDSTLSVLDSGDRLFYGDLNGDGIFNGLDPVVYIPFGESTISSVLFGTTVDGINYYPAETASEYMRYVDVDKNGDFTPGTDILVLDWNDNLVYDENNDDYQSFNAVAEHTLGGVAYVFAASIDGGVFYAPVSNTTSWKKLDVRDTGTNVKRMYVNGTSLYICSSRDAAIIEVSALTTNFIDSTSVVATTRNVAKGANGSGNIDTKIRGVRPLLSTGVISPTVSVVGGYNQYAQNMTSTKLFNELSDSDMKQLLISNGFIKNSGTVLRVTSVANLSLTATANKTLFGTNSQATGTIIKVGTLSNYVIITPNTGTFAVSDQLQQPMGVTATSSVLSITQFSTITTTSALGTLLTNLGVVLSGTNENRVTQMISAGVINSSFSTSASVISNIPFTTLLLSARGITDASKILITNFATDEGKMYIYSKVKIEDSNGNPPIVGSTVSVKIEEVETDTDTSGTISDVVRNHEIYTFNYTYSDTTNRGPGSTEFYHSVALGFIIRDPTTAPSGLAYNDFVRVTVGVTNPSGSTAPGSNGISDFESISIISRSGFTPTGGGTLIRQ